MTPLCEFAGEIAISPPLAWEEIVDGPPLAGLRLRLADDGEDVRAYDAAVPTTGRDLAAELQALVDAHGERHEFTGHIEVNGGVWRLAVRDGRAVRIEPRLVWPDEPARRAPLGGRGICPSCGREATLTLVRGVMFAHRDGDGNRCDGRGRPPVRITVAANRNA